MAEVVKMPRLSDTMEEGTVAKWHKKVGDKVSEGDLLAEIETDKATMDFEAFQEGVLLHIGVEEGDTAAVDSVLAILGEKGEDISGLLEGGDSSGSDQKEEKQKKNDSSDKEEESDDAEEDHEDDNKESDKDKEVSASDGRRLKASPLAKKLAEEKGIDISDVEGSGEGGRIVKRDIDNYKPSAKGTAAKATALGEESYEDVKVSQMRKTIAKRLAESKFTAPHFYLTLDIDMENASMARKAINEMMENKVSFNDLVIKACAAALKKHPAVNSAWLGDKIRRNEHIHIGVAVAVDEGLVVPVVRHADIKGLAAINAEVKDMAGKARNKKLPPEDMEGGTFAVSNLGMFGIEEFTAIINPPNSCILAVGAIREEPVVKNGQIVIGQRMKVTLSCDHRTVDGATGAAFLQTLKGMLENPAAMLV
ncbi:MAG: pyruvate dehydrogenase complex dihydrolipoamide acetyltransferase [Owenweeksia sp.]|nr:pyruvate dehydrogenase complex dihydrolipoamide acetyltransferase [Owenweeksia sp.]MBG00417.1 pyruvate dehydrogenase complex dihydrolipoamide acetyltransferase [Owenweeksia sp.]HBF20780.1 pyruvate dehydrogenase complex dihydrolipoamide acetyltransferase [Cryomorphaceae bacterium]|tara:strand:- start:1593 stop:2858 length:1266 start_codon:yes stop_codon:yes gene_type:complete